MSVKQGFLISALLRFQDKEEAWRCSGPQPPGGRTAGLKNISLLYQYVNVPPLGVGVTGAKVAESVFRSVTHNPLPDSGVRDEPTQMWPSGIDYPLDQITSNFSPSCCRLMFEDFLKTNVLKIDQRLEETWDHLLTTNSDVLTQGRQTWDPINQRSVPSAQAYPDATKLLDVNNIDRRRSLAGLIQAFHNALSRETLVVNSKNFFVNKVTNVRDPKTGMMKKATKKVVKMETKTLTGTQVWEYIFGLSTSFCAYLKGKERGKLERRATASANMFFRAHLYIVETFHLELCRDIEGSIIGIGGEEKKEKILRTLETVKTFPYSRGLRYSKQQMTSQSTSA